MAKVPAYHTDSEEEPPANREFHHNDDACYEGTKIRAEHLVFAPDRACRRRRSSGA
jgi:hypothetical protein